MLRMPLPLIFAIFCFAASPAFAHVGQGTAAGFAHGLAHPLSGVDHVIAMLAVGVYAAMLGGRSLALLPLAFVGLMIVGGALGYGGLPLPLAEQGIGLSVVVMSLAVAAGLRLRAETAMALVALFAIFHGHAHGSEGASIAAFLPYASGFVIMTALLHLAGIGLGLALDRLNPSVAGGARWVGGGAGALAGIAILAGAI
jgi:urease accessory protein